MKTIKTQKTILHILKFILICALWITLWGVLSAVVDKELLLPSPLSVGKRLIELAAQEKFYVATFFSLFRVLVGIVVSMVTALIMAYLTSKIKLLHDILTPLLTVIKATPVASFILLAFLWVDKEILPAFVSFLIIFPIIWSNTEMGILNVDKNHIELGKVFSLKPLTKLRRIYIPSIMPYFISAMRTSIGLAFKAAIAAEVIFPSLHSIGKALNDSKMYLEITDLFAWTAVVIFLSFIMEYLFGFLLKRLGNHYNVKGGL